MGLLVFLITLIGLFTFAEFYPVDNALEKQVVKTNFNDQDNLKITIK